MSKLLAKLRHSFSSNTSSVVLQTVACLIEMFKFLNGRREEKRQKQQIEREQQFSDEVDDIADNGSLDDLVNLRRKDIK